MTAGGSVRVLEGYPDGLRVIVDGDEESHDNLSLTGSLPDDAETAGACLDVMADFIEDAIGLYQAMSGETWE